MKTLLKSISEFLEKLDQVNVDNYASKRDDMIKQSHEIQLRIQKELFWEGSVVWRGDQFRIHRHRDEYTVTTAECTRIKSFPFGKIEREALEEAILFTKEIEPTPHFYLIATLPDQKSQSVVGPLFSYQEIDEHEILLGINYNPDISLTKICVEGSKSYII